MAVANYQYYSDSGTLYQVSVPVDFATALGMTPALGTEPYLDAAISPRYAWFYQQSGSSRQALVQTRTLLSQINSQYSVGGVTYFTRSTQSESIPPYPGQLYNFPQGPMGSPGPTGATGPSGPPGVSNSQYFTISADATLTSANTNYTILTESYSAGTWLIGYSLLMDATGLGEAGISVASATPVAASASIPPGSGEPIQLSGVQILVLSGITSIQLWARCNAASAVVKKSGPNYTLATYLWSLQLA